MDIKNSFYFLDLFGEIDEHFIQEISLSSTKNKRSIKLKKITAAAIILLILGTAIFSSKTAIAGLKHLTTIISELLGFETDSIDYTKILEKTVCQNGLSITLKEVILDENKMYISFETDAENKNKEDCLLIGDTWINGNKLTGYDSFSDSLENTSSHTRKVLSYNFDSQYITQGSVSVKILLYPTDPDTMEEYGEFLFEFKASADQLKKHTLTLPLTTNIQIESDSVLSLKGFSLNAVGSDITGIWNNLPSVYREYSIEYFLMGKDNLNNPVRYRMRLYENPTVYFTLQTKEGIISSEAESLSLQLYGQFLPLSDGDITEYYEEMNPSRQTDTANFELDDYKIFTDNPMKPFKIGQEFEIKFEDK